MDLLDGFPTNISVQFHEVDSMKIVHHSYYIYWMEKARFHFAESMLGFSFQEFESMSFSLPVTSLKSKYMQSAILGQKIVIYLKIVERDEAIVTFIYEMRDAETGKKLFEGCTEHVFVNKLGKLHLQYPVQWTSALEEVKKKNDSYIVKNKVHA